MEEEERLGTFAADDVMSPVLRDEWIVQRSS